MKHREKLFKLLRECVETPQESFAVEEMIRKVNGDMLPIESIGDTQKKFAGLKFYRKKKYQLLLRRQSASFRLDVLQRRNSRRL